MTEMKRWNEPKNILLPQIHLHEHLINIMTKLTNTNSNIRMHEHDH